MGGCELESGDVVLAAIPIRKMTIGIAQTLPLIIDWRIAMPKRTTGGRPELKPVNVGAAAIDIGSKMHMAAVNPACTDVPVRTFGTFTQDLHDLADFPHAELLKSVARRIVDRRVLHLIKMCLECPVEETDDLCWSSEMRFRFIEDR